MKEYVASQTPSDLAGSGWYEILQAPESAQVLDNDISADWIIVGGGFTGLSAARQLDQLVAGTKIAVVDAQRIGWGAAGRNSGFMIDLPHDLQSADYGADAQKDITQIKLNRAAIAFAAQTVKEYQLQKWWDPAGKINGATDGAGMAALESYASHLSNLNEAHSFLSAEAMQQVTGTDYYAGGLHTPGCVQIQPAAYIRGLAAGLRNSKRNEIQIYENSPVIKIQPGTGPVIETADGRIQGGKIILTVNGHLASFGFYQKQLMHLFTFASMTRPLSATEQKKLGGQPCWGITPAHPMGTTVRKTAEGRIVVRNTFTFNPNMKTTDMQVHKLGVRHDKSFYNRFPMLSGVKMDYRWGGHLCLSRNSVPVFGELEKNLFVSCCQNGLGVAHGTLGGMLIARLAAERPCDMVNIMLESEEPSRLPPDPFLTIGAKARLWWSQSRAGKDL
ncbi:MAG: FAD-binding oxidoreductase [Acidiferrobacterales bacterium]|nr:FAD-binding oxidoreductase [Acidiferrobacterales bacterium]